jgi:nucleoside-triphosphatase THEP1
LVRLAGFKTPFVQKLDLEVSSVDAPETFDALAREARRLLMHSAKVMLLVGPPRSGKTTLLSRIVEERRDHPGLFFLLSTARWAERERLGFDYTSSAQPAPVPFAERQPSGTYDVLTQALDPAIAHMGKAQSEGKVLLVDEIGPMQLRNEAFRKCIEDLVNDPRVSLLASLAEPQQCIGAARVFVESLMRHRRSTVLRLSGPEDTEPLRRELQEELDAALLLAAQMPREAWG